MPINTAAWLPANRARLQVGPAPYTPPGAGEIVVRNAAVAVNPVDWIIQAAGGFIFGFIKPPFVLGSDLAGEVVEVGEGVSRFKVGDRVVGHAVGGAPERNRSSEGAFQAYTVLLAHMTSPIPDSLSYEAAAVLPLGLSTAACGLFQPDHLALPYPTVPARAGGDTVLIWGGATSVGANAIQLAVAAGCRVITTASPRNFDFVRGLGAEAVFDYSSPTAVRDIVAAFEGRVSAGALAIGANSAAGCVAVMSAVRGKRFVSIATFPIAFADMPSGAGAAPAFFAKIPGMLAANIGLAVRCRLRGINTKAIFGSSLAGNAVGPAIYQDFLPRALAEDRFVAAPPPRVVGQGLESVQAALDAQRKGVSAAKIVVSLGA